jgi:hypothetical protein
MTERRTFLPMAIARLVQQQGRNEVDIEGELRSLLDGGHRRITVGLGLGVDVPLLDQELHAAEIAELDRDLIVAVVRAEPDGYVVERGWSNFGVYVWTDAEPIWQSVTWMGMVRALRPGDKVALGSTPADAVQFRLPESTLVPPRLHRRSQRLERATEERKNREPTPPADPQLTTPGARTPGAHPTPGPGRTPTSAAPARPAPLRVDSDRFQARFDVAIKHWRYAMITIGGDDGAVITLDDPDLVSLRAALGRNLEQPDRGYELFVKDPTPEMWVQPTGAAARLLARADVVKLRGAGNRIGFAGYVVHLPDPAAPIPRFGPRQFPTMAEVADVLGLPDHHLADPDIVKARYRELVLRFHPDRHDGDPGHLSRFLEIQACFDLWKRT